MGVNLVDFHDALEKRRTFGFFDDFEWLVTAHRWTTLVADTTPTVTVPDAANGIVRLFTDTTNNNEVAVHTTAECLLFAANKPFVLETKIQYSENDTNKANVAFGCADAFGANLLVDDGAGPKTSFSGLLIFKVDGGTAWKVVSSLSTTQTISTSTVTAGGTAYQTLRIECQPINATVAEAKFYVDGQQLLDAATSPPRPIKHVFTYTNATEMSAGLYVKTGGGAGGEIVLADYFALELLR